MVHTFDITVRVRLDGEGGFDESVLEEYGLEGALETCIEDKLSEIHGLAVGAVRVREV